MWGCDNLQSIWAIDFVWVDRTRVQSSSFSELLKLIREKPSLVPLFAATAWSVWWPRNKTRLQEHSLPLEKISSFAKEYIQDFKNLGLPLRRNRPAAAKKWTPLATGSMKTNYMMAPCLVNQMRQALEWLFVIPMGQLWQPSPKRLRNHLLWKLSSYWLRGEQLVSL
nr:hypothetical protein CFP56_35806 [Quercus suber]